MSDHPVALTRAEMDGAARFGSPFGTYCGAWQRDDGSRYICLEPPNHACAACHQPKSAPIHDNPYIPTAHVYAAAWHCDLHRAFNCPQCFNYPTQGGKPMSD